MSHYTLVGVDPGLVHTGVVGIRLDVVPRTIRVLHEIVPGDFVHGVQVAVLSVGGNAHEQGWIEQYRDRGTVFSTHSDMRAFEVKLNAALPGYKLQSNSGAKKLISNKLMRVLGCGKFPTTNHRDLEAAARIAILGAMKRPDLNEILATVVRDHLDGSPWTVL